MRQAAMWGHLGHVMPGDQSDRLSALFLWLAVISSMADWEVTGCVVVMGASASTPCPSHTRGNRHRNIGERKGGFSGHGSWVETREGLEETQPLGKAASSLRGRAEEEVAPPAGS